MLAYVLACISTYLHIFPQSADGKGLDGGRPYEKGRVVEKEIQIQQFISPSLTQSSLLKLSSFVLPLPINRQPKYAYIWKYACQYIR